MELIYEGKGWGDFQPRSDGIHAFLDKQTQILLFAKRLSAFGAWWWKASSHVFSQTVSEKEPSLLGIPRVWNSCSNGSSSMKSRFPEVLTSALWSHTGAWDKGKMCTASIYAHQNILQNILN